jgi:hypothetical protein
MHWSRCASTAGERIRHVGVAFAAYFPEVNRQKPRLAVEI